MQGFTAEFAETVQRSHTAVVLAEVIQNGKVVATLDVHAGSVNADRTAAQLRTMEFEVVDRNGTITPSGMTSLLAPFGTFIQLYRGVRIKNVETLSAVYGVGANSWTPQSTGDMNGVTKGADGSLVLGP
jgi:hypothetical protein